MYLILFCKILDPEKDYSNHGGYKSVMSSLYKISKNFLLNICLILGGMPLCSFSADVLVSRNLPDTYSAGEEIIVTLQIAVTGERAPYAVIVKETLPSNWNVVSSSPKYSSYTVEDGQLKWLFNSPERVQSQEIQYILIAPENASGSITFSGTYLYADDQETIQTFTTVGDELITGALPKNTPTPTPDEQPTPTPTQSQDSDEKSPNKLIQSSKSIWVYEFDHAEPVNDGIVITTPGETGLYKPAAISSGVAIPKDDETLFPSSDNLGAEFSVDQGQGIIAYFPAQSADSEGVFLRTVVWASGPGAQIALAALDAEQEKGFTGIDGSIATRIPAKTTVFEGGWNEIVLFIDSLKDGMIPIIQIVDVSGDPTTIYVDKIEILIPSSSIPVTRGVPDLTILDASVSNLFGPSRMGKPIQALIENIGTLYAKNIKVRFLYGDGQTHTETIESLDPLEHIKIRYYEQDITYPITITVDPDNSIFELSEENNDTTVSQTIDPLTDLPENLFDTSGYPGSWRRMALFRREREDSSGNFPEDARESALRKRDQMRLPNLLEDDPGGRVPEGDVRASLITEDGVSLPVSNAVSPVTLSSFGNTGRFVQVSSKNVFRNAALKIGLTPKEVKDIDPGSLRIFHFDQATQSFQLIARSGLGHEGNYVFARIKKPGVYGVFGLPRDQGRLFTLQLIQKSQALSRLQNAVSDGADPFIEKGIADLILRSSLLAPVIKDPFQMDQFGFQDIISDARLLEGDVLGPVPRDQKGHPIDRRPYIQSSGKTLSDNKDSNTPSQDVAIKYQLPGRRGIDDLVIPSLDKRIQTKLIPGYQILNVPTLGSMYTAPEGNWKSMGPNNIAGRVKALAFDPTNSSILYAGVAEGGVFKGFNIADKMFWIPVMDKMKCLSIGDVAVSKSDPNFVYAGTGEYVTNNWSVGSSYPGIGVYRSTDYGSHWEKMPGTVSSRISKILVHPTNPHKIYVAGNRGIHRWDETDEAWTQITHYDTTDMVFHPNNPNCIFAGMESNKGIRVTYTADSNATWTSYNAGITFPTHINDIPYYIKLASCPSEPAVMYARINQEREDPDHPGIWYDYSGVYRYNPQTSSWEDKGEAAGKSYYFWCSCIEVDPTDSDRVFVGGVRLAWSSNGGDTWHALGEGHADVHDIEFDHSNSNRTFIANDGGVWTYTQSPGETEWNYQEDNTLLTSVQFYNVSVSQTGPFTLGGSTQDQGILMVHEGKNYDAMGGNEGGIFEVDPNNGNTIYWDPWSGDLRRTETGYGGNDKRDATNGIERLLDDDGEPTKCPSVTALAINSFDSDTLLCSAPGRNDTFPIYRSTDGAMGGAAVGWVKVLDDAGSKVQRIAWAPSVPNKAYACTEDGRVYRTVNTGVDWNWISNSSSLPAENLKGLAVDWNDSDKVYVTYGGSDLNFGHVWASNDGGQSWYDISGAESWSRLQDIHTCAIVVHKDHPDTLYVCNDTGVYMTNDGGDNWYPFDRNLPNAILSDMDYQPHAQKLYVSTIGRGMYMTELE
jgi:photosystem II stability/assembly factor-like uncharacterized protein